MINYSGGLAAGLDGTFAALADGTRRAILARLATGEATVTELARPFEISLPAVSRHLRVLEEAGLLSRRREGRRLHCRLETARLAQASAWIARQSEFWELRLDSLERYLTTEQRSKRRRPR
jgi:DNA-binding transcriptional ArsR family regulator